MRSTIVRNKYILYEDGRLFDLISGQFKSTFLNTKGYPCFSISRFMLVHRALAQAFIPNPLRLTQVNHKDGNKLNWRLDNLEWSSNSQNIKHAIQTGLMKKKVLSTAQAKEINQPKRVIEIDLFGRTCAHYESICEAAKVTGIDKNLISKVCLGKQKTTNQRRFSFA